MRVFCLLALFTVAFAGEPNGVETPGFVPPVLIPLSDASIVVGTPVWNSTDGKEYVVNAKSTSTATLIEARSTGFTITPAFPLTTKVQVLTKLIITIPPDPVAPSATASNP